MAEKTHFVRQVVEYLYPAQNRVIAAVAFVRTFKQTLTGAGVVGGGGLITITATDLAAITWDTVLYTAIALVLTALIAAGAAFDDVSRNGLNSKYLDAATAPAPPVVIDAGAVGAAVKGLQNSRPFWMVPAGTVPAPAAVEAPAEAPKATATKPETKRAAASAAKKAAVNKKAANEAGTELKGGIAQQAPAVEVTA